MRFKIVKVEFICTDFLFNFFSLLFVKLVLRFFYQGDDITHTQDTLCHTLRIEYIQGIQLLTHAHKLNRLIYRVFDRQGSTTAGIAIQFGQYNTCKVQAIIEGFCRIYRILTGHRIYYEQDLRWVYRIFDVSHLGHHHLIYGQTAGSIDDHYLVTILFCFSNRSQCNAYRIFIFRIAVHGYIDLLSQYMQLVDRRRAINISCYQ
ncbi:hypothetical protein FQZ97_859640 [compost metagenome]